MPRYLNYPAGENDMSQPSTRPSGRDLHELRDLEFTRNFTCHAEGSVLVSFGNTRVICTASINPGVPGFLRGKGQGWLTAEYGMLPRSTGSRMRRGHPSYMLMVNISRRPTFEV